LLFVRGVRQRGILHGRSCRESPEKRFEFLFFTDQFGVGAKFFLIKLSITDIAIGACSKWFPASSLIQESLGIRNSSRLKT
jgi:hypothetical protein